jgi:hypothetical protein
VFLCYEVLYHVCHMLCMLSDIPRCFTVLLACVISVIRDVTGVCYQCYARCYRPDRIRGNGPCS